MSFFNDTMYQAFLNNPEKYGFTYDAWKEWYSKQLGKEFSESFDIKKPYFSKWIPVEDNSNSDNWQWFNNVQNTGWENISPSDMDAIIAHGLNPSPKFRKVKLFLCSRDIQVGDKVFLENGYNWFGTVLDKINNSDRDIVLDKMPEERKTGTLDYREMVKIIGEISPDATWVTDGMEFNEDDIQLSCEDRKFPDDSVFDLNGDFAKFKKFADDLIQKKPHRYFILVRIKCPTCKMFH